MERNIEQHKGKKQCRQSGGVNERFRDRFYAMHVFLLDYVIVLIINNKIISVGYDIFKRLVKYRKSDCM